uniref:ATP synthase F0 subunit 6 n=1 Tax=Mesocestoides sp. RKZ08 TaxID=2854038 RepID=UPI001F1332E4|nr:ATP synthase F0 subunit 6 [Mesocestoides sp. RKZ08]UKS07966.1 ATP synthase F0 subunit 6 [Mesocestoides sp. RKZ08]
MVIYNRLFCVIVLLYKYFVCMFSYYYLMLLYLVILLFLLYRFPYCYSPFLFICFLIFVVFIMFLSLFFRRVFFSFSNFFSSFIPVGTPGYICPLVCLAETVSYFIRPFVLIFRPFINITLGCYGAVAVGGFSLSSNLWLFILFLIFFYEVFVALVHWFIVTNILSFSVDH